MAKSAASIVTGIITIACCASLWAQKKGGVKHDSKPAAKDTVGLAKRKTTKPVVYLGHTNFAGGIITPDDFKAGLHQGISSKDDAGNPLKIVGFTFQYAERRLFEDEAGNLQMMTDFSQEYCPGDTVTPTISRTIYDLAKSGDTVYFSQVMIERRLGNELDTIMGKELKCFIRKKNTTPEIK